jgi:hypothetical protein
MLKNLRITTQSWNPAVDAPVDEYGSQFIGDYQGLSADNYFVHPFWNDTRTGAQEIFTAAVPLKDEHPIFTGSHHHGCWWALDHRRDPN